MIKRNLTPKLLDALGDTPVVLLNGARQTGKSTLAKQIISDGYPARYLTLDEAPVLSAAKDDPAGFLAGLDGPVVIDEVQRAPELFLAIKVEVDRNRRPGRFLLTGSTDALLLPGLSESLAGRMEVLTLWPFSQGEIEGIQEDFIDTLFGDRLPFWSNLENRDDTLRRIVTGAYPEVIERKNEERRRAWFGAYVTTILQRDIRDISNIDGFTVFPRLLSLLASRATSTLNIADLSRSTDVPQTTLRRYLSLLEATFLIHQLPPWFTNIGKRLVKSPKLLLTDTGLMSYELGINAERLQAEPSLSGRLFENFIAMELLKQTTWSHAHPVLYHFRTQRGEEVDIILEDAAGNVVGIESKASATVSGDDFKGLRLLAASLGKKLKRGIILYTGRETIPFGQTLHAVPVSALWQRA